MTSRQRRSSSREREDRGEKPQHEVMAPYYFEIWLTNKRSPDTRVHKKNHHLTPGPWQPLLPIATAHLILRPKPSSLIISLINTMIYKLAEGINLGWQIGWEIIVAIGTMKIVDDPLCRPTIGMFENEQTWIRTHKSTPCSYSIYETSGLIGWTDKRSNRSET